jgi:hypothetical protein
MWKWTQYGEVFGVKPIRNQKQERKTYKELQEINHNENYNNKIVRELIESLQRQKEGRFITQTDKGE